MDWYAGVLLLSLRFSAISAINLTPFSAFRNVAYEPIAEQSANRQIFLPNAQVTSRYPFLNTDHLTKTFRLSTFPGFENPGFPISPITAAASSFDVSIPTLRQRGVVIDKNKVPLRNKPNFYSDQTKEQRVNKNNVGPPGKQALRAVTLDIRGGGYKIEPPKSSRPYKPPSAGDINNELRGRRKNNNNQNNVGRESSLRPRSRRPNKPQRPANTALNPLYQNIRYENSIRLAPNVEIESPDNVLPFNPKMYKQIQQMFKQGKYVQPGNSRDTFLPFNSGGFGNLRMTAGNVPDTYKSTAMQLLPGRNNNGLPTDAINSQHYNDFSNSFPSFQPQQFFAQFNTQDKTVPTSQFSKDFFSRDPNAQVSSANGQVDQNAYQHVQPTFQQGQTQSFNSAPAFYYQPENIKSQVNEKQNYQTEVGQANPQASLTDGNFPASYLQAFYNTNLANMQAAYPGFSQFQGTSTLDNQQLKANTNQQITNGGNVVPAVASPEYFFGNSQLQDQVQNNQANPYLTTQQAAILTQTSQQLTENKVPSKFIEAIQNLSPHSQNAGAIALSMQTPSGFQYNKHIQPQYTNAEYTVPYTTNQEAYLQPSGVSVYENAGDQSQKSESQTNQDTNKPDLKLYSQAVSHSNDQSSYISNESLFGKTSLSPQSSSLTYSSPLDSKSVASQTPESLLKQLTYASAHLTPENLYYQQLGNSEQSSKFKFSPMDTPSPPVFSRPVVTRNQNDAESEQPSASKTTQKEGNERAALHLSEQMSVYVSDNPPHRHFYHYTEEYDSGNAEVNSTPTYEYGPQTEVPDDQGSVKNKTVARETDKRTQVSNSGHRKDLYSYEIPSGQRTTTAYKESPRKDIVTVDTTTTTTTTDSSLKHHRIKYHDPVPASTSTPIDIPVQTKRPVFESIKTEYNEIPICALHSNATYCLQDPEYPKDLIKQAIERNRHPLDRFLNLDSMSTQIVPEKLDQNSLRVASSSVSYSFEGNLVAPTQEEANNNNTGCSSNTYFAKPLRAINTAGQWKIIVNVEFGDTESNYTQTVRIEECSRKDGFLAICGGETISACLQQYKLYRLLAWDPIKNFYIDSFLLPISCFCGSKHTTE